MERCLNQGFSKGQWPYISHSQALIVGHARLPTIGVCLDFKNTPKNLCPPNRPTNNIANSFVNKQAKITYEGLKQSWLKAYGQLKGSVEGRFKTFKRHPKDLRKPFPRSLMPFRRLFTNLTAPPKRPKGLDVFRMSFMALEG